VIVYFGQFFKTAQVAKNFGLLFFYWKFLN
jgi:hypothetical protein